MLNRLLALYAELESPPAAGSEEFAVFALSISRATTRAAFEEMIAASRAGKPDREVAAAVPLAVGFLLNCVLNVWQCDGDADMADNLFDRIRAVTRELGDGASTVLTSRH